MNNLVGSTTNYNNSVPMPQDGVDTETAASLQAGFQQLADNVATERADRVAAVTTALAALADTNALAAIAAPADGSVRQVLAFGWYTFKTAATTGLFPFRVAAADATPGGWVANDAHQPTLVRQLPVMPRVRGITGAAAGAPAAAPPTTTNPTCIPLGQADAGVFVTGFWPARAFTGATNNFGYIVDINDGLVDGATLTSAQLLFGAFGHAALPTRQPSFGIVRSIASSRLGTATNLLSGATGLVTLAAASQPAYDAAQSLVFVPDQNNVIDKTQYNYAAVIWDEAGSNSGAGGLGFLGCAYNSIQLLMAITDARRS